MLFKRTTKNIRTKIEVQRWEDTRNTKQRTQQCNIVKQNRF